MANIVMEVSYFFYLFIYLFFLLLFFSCEFSVSISWACIKLKYGSHAIYVHKIRYNTAVRIHVLRWLSTLLYLYFSFRFRNEKKKHYRN